jgi:hypothetical protein
MKNRGKSMNLKRKENGNREMKNAANYKPVSERASEKGRADSSPLHRFGMTRWSG